MSTVQHDLDTLLGDVQAAEARLKTAVADACPGEHRPVVHRDRLPAWCETCGRDDRGRHWRKDRPYDRHT